MSDRIKIKYWWSEDQKWFCILTDDGVNQSTVSLTVEEASLLSMNAVLDAPIAQSPREAVIEECARLVDGIGNDAFYEPDRNVATYIAKCIRALVPVASTDNRDDLGLVLSALRYFESAVGEKYDDEGGVIAAIERDHVAVSQASGTESDNG